MSPELVDDSVGFVGFIPFHAQGRELSFRSSPHRLSVSFASPDDMLWVCGILDLHDRGQLAERLGLRHNVADFELVQAAYRKWDSQCPEYLNGRFAFSLWDRASRRVFCARDHLGSIPFFYRLDRLGFSFAGSVPGLLGQGDQPDLNADTLLRSRLPCGYWMREGETFHRDLFSLPPACSLTLHAESVRITKFWELSVNPHPVAINAQEAFAAVRAVVESGVNEALKQTVAPAVLLSGGLDSSVIAAVAARRLAARGLPLNALTSVSEEGPDRLPHEGPWASELRTHSNLVLHEVPANGCGPFDDLGHQEKFLGSPLVHPRRYMHRALSAQAAALNVDTLLTGSYGEYSVSASAPQFFFERILRGEWRLLLQDLRQNARSRRVSSLRILASDIRSHLAKRQRNEDRYYFTTGFLNQLTEPPFSYPALLSENHTVELTNVRRLLNYLDTALCSQGEYPLGQRVDAFWDRRLLELCLALPATLKVRDGFRRYLCRKPFEDILPPRITWRRDKMPFSADYRRRYAAQRGRALEYVLSIRPSDPVREIVDVPRLARELSAPDSAVPYRHTNVEIPNSIYLIHFLRQFPGFRV